MTALVSVAERLNNLQEALQPLITSAELNKDAAYARAQFSKATTELVAAKRLVNSMIGSFAHAHRRASELPVQAIPGLIVIDGAPDLGTTAQGERVLVTFDRAARVPRSAWPPVDPLDEGVDGEGSDLCRAL